MSHCLCLDLISSACQDDNQRLLQSQALYHQGLVGMENKRVMYEGNERRQMEAYEEMRREVKQMRFYVQSLEVSLSANKCAILFAGR